RTVCSAGSPDDISFFVQRLKSQERAAKRDARWEPMTGQVLNANSSLQILLVTGQRSHFNLRRFVFRKIIARLLRGLQTENARGVHVVGGADTQDVGKLLEHHQPKLIESDQSVARKLIAHPQG